MDDPQPPIHPALPAESVMVPPVAAAAPPPIPPAPPSPRPAVAGSPPARRKSNFGWWIVIVLMGLGLCLVLVAVSINSFFSGLVPSPSSFSSHNGPHFMENVVEEGNSRQRVLVIPMEGIITSMPLDHVGYSMVQLLEHLLKKAADDASIKAVILKVDSPGGEVLASDDMYKLLKDFQTEHRKPVVAVMGSMAASGGYYISAPCQWIIANPLTITGSIGVIMRGLNYRGLMDKVGLRPEVFKSGRLKDMLSGEKREDEITAEERSMVQKMVNDTFDRFKEVVAEGRDRANRVNSEQDEAKGKGRKLTTQWVDYADGRILSGKEAHELGFVDELGNFKTAIKRAATLAQIHDPEVIELQPQFDISNLFRLFGESRTSRIKVDVGLPSPPLRPGYMYYLWSMAVPQSQP